MMNIFSNENVIIGILGSILGAMFGTISTLIITHILKYKGDIILDSNRCKIEYYKSKAGGKISVDTANEADIGNLTMELYIFNSSEVIKSLKNIKFELIRKGFTKELKMFFKEDGLIDMFDHINLYPQRLIKMVLKSDEIEKKYLKEELTIVVKAVNSRNRIFKKELTKISNELEKTVFNEQSSSSEGGSVLKKQVYSLFSKRKVFIFLITILSIAYLSIVFYEHYNYIVLEGTIHSYMQFSVENNKADNQIPKENLTILTDKHFYKAIPDKTKAILKMYGSTFEGIIETKSLDEKSEKLKIGISVNIDDLEYYPSERVFIKVRRRGAQIENN
ncbi:MAG: hypothetical protein KAX49_19965 [Halanaerobiales bacterium]|nr:hypothetical protein [Halanaerobiales bacterium]